MLFSGEVIEKEWEDKQGVMVGTTHIRGLDHDAGHSMDVWFLNENHVAWLDGKPFVFSPDLIILANTLSGEGYTNTEIKVWRSCFRPGRKNPPFFRTEKSIQFYGPRYWGFDFDYLPIEQAVAAV